MSNRPPLNWSRVLGELKADRLALKPVREERLRPAQGLRGTPALALSAWRGQSGRRYVVGIVPLAEFDSADAAEAVVLFIKRDATGAAEIVAHGCDLTTVDAFAMAGVAKGLGASESHLHRIEPDADRRFVIFDDLRVKEAEVV